VWQESGLAAILCDTVLVILFNNISPSRPGIFLVLVIICYDIIIIAVLA